MWRVEKKVWSTFLCFGSLLYFLSSIAGATTLPGTKLTNTVMAKYSIAGEELRQTAMAFVVTDPMVEFMTEKIAGSPTLLSETMCASVANGEPLDRATGVAPQSLGLASTKTYHSGQTVYLKTTDRSINQNPAKIETVVVSITS
ncbi:MAG: hypothetical protein ACJAUP_001886, partial [Cellvibrionaceae bacterium]